ncbi:MAG: heme-binding protein [Pseudomonadota bacterium]
MASISLNKANQIIRGSFASAKEMGLKPLTTVVLDDGGHVVACQRQDGASPMRFEIAKGKAFGAVATGVGSRWLNEQAETRPHFLEGLSGVSGGRIVPVPGGVLVKNKNGKIIGAVGITGDTSDNDEAAAKAAIEAAGYEAVTG